MKLVRNKRIGHSIIHCGLGLTDHLLPLLPICKAPPLLLEPLYHEKSRLNAGNIFQEGGAPMRPLKEKVSITLDSDLVKVVKELAYKDDRSFSQYINRVLRQHVNQESQEEPRK